MICIYIYIYVYIYMLIATRIKFVQSGKLFIYWEILFT